MMRRVFTNWPQKIGSLVLAAGIWFLVTTNTDSTSQRSLIIPVSYEAVGADQVVSGAPPSVEIVVAGQSSLVNRLRPENFSASLNFAGVTGAYERRVNVITPQGIRLLSVYPETAIGNVETITSKTVPVVVSWLELPLNSLPIATASPSTVTVLGPNSKLERIVQVIAIAEPLGDLQVVTVFAADASDTPITDLDVTLNPRTVELQVISQPVLHRRRVDLVLQLPDFDPVIIEAIAVQTSLEVAGSWEQVEGLTEVVAVTGLTTPVLQSGEYTLLAQARLPEGVYALEEIPVVLELFVPDPEGPTEAPEPLTPTEPNGVHDDPSNSSLR